MGLTKKILLFTALLTVGIVAATLGFSTVQANALAQAFIEQQLEFRFTASAEAEDEPDHEHDGQQRGEDGEHGAWGEGVTAGASAALLRRFAHSPNRPLYPG